MARSKTPTFGRGTPDWLRHIAGDPSRLGNAKRLANALSIPKNGRGAVAALEVAALTFEVHALHAELEIAANWAEFARDLAAAGRQATKYPQLALETTDATTGRGWHALTGLARARTDSLSTSAAVVLSTALLDAIRANSGLPEFIPVTVSSLASASSPGSHRETRLTWAALSALVLAKPLTPEVLDAIARFGRSAALHDARALAKYLHGAMTRTGERADPGDAEGYPKSATASDGPIPVTWSEGQEHSPSKSPDDAPLAYVPCAPPSVRSLPKAASFARMPELFAVPTAWNRLPPQRLAPITSAAKAALNGGVVAPNHDAALIGVMAIVISHDLGPAIELSLEDNGDLWYSREHRCVLAHRRLLLRLEDDQPGPTWYVVYVPASAAEAIDRLLEVRPHAKRLRELFDPARITELLAQAAAWLKSLSDPAHPAWSARVAHSLGLVYLACGATPAEAGLHTLNTALAPAAVGNYYQPDPVRLHALATRVFQLLGLGEPGPVVEPEPDDSAIAPSDDEVRAEWQHYRSRAQAAYRALISAADFEAVVAALNTAMAATRRAYKLLTGGRPQRRGQPSLRDVGSHADWVRQDDERTRPLSERLLPRTQALAEVIRVAHALRAAARQRLQELGLEESTLPVLLRDPPPGSMLFFRLHRMERRGRSIVATSPLDADTMALVPQLWQGPANMGRRYWATQASRSQYGWAEMVITGHGRGLANVGTACLAMPVMRLLKGARTLCDEVLSRLMLDAFGEHVAGEAPEISFAVDLRHIDRRHPVATRATDLPQHHCDSHSLAALAVVEALRRETGRAGALSPAARALLSLIVNDGLIHSADVQAAWACLTDMETGQQAANKAIYLRFTRASGQPICMPLEPQTRLARDEMRHWPALEVAEAELSAWLISTWPDIRWPEKARATITAVCWLASRWVRLQVPTILLEAYRPENLAATLSDTSLQALLEPGSRSAPFSAQQLRKLRRRRHACPEGKTDLQWLLKRLGRIARSDEALGGRQRRANLIRRMAPRLFNTAAMAHDAVALYDWLLAECPLTYDDDPDAIAPSTFYEYFSRVHSVLHEHWPEGKRARDLHAQDWTTLTHAMATRHGDESAENVSRRVIAWARILKTLSRNEGYRKASAGMTTLGEPPTERRYRPSAASALVLGEVRQELRIQVDALHDDEPLDGLQAQALSGLLLDGGDRCSEACAARAADLARDGSFVATTSNAMAQGKTDAARRITPASAATAADLIALRDHSSKLQPPSRYLFAQRGTVVNKRFALEKYHQVVDLLRLVGGNEEITGHSCRGSAAMRLLAPQWEVLMRRWVSGPLELVHAQALMSALAGDGPSHLADVLTSIGHASHRTFARHYMSAWPLFYAAAMRATQADLPLDPSLIRQQTRCQTRRIDRTLSATEIATAEEKALDARRSYEFATPVGEPVDSWAWALKRAYWPTWRRDLKRNAPRTQAEAHERPAPASAAAPAPPQPQRALLFRYLLLRRLRLPREACLQTAKIGKAGSELAESMLSTLPTLDEALGRERKKSEVPGPLLNIARGIIDDAGGRALLAAIRRSSPTSAAALQGILMPRASAPQVTVERVLAARDLLPAAIAIELIHSAALKGDGLVESLELEPRVRARHRDSWTASRPRVRLYAAQDVLDINDTRASALTLIAQMALALWAHLRLENSS